MLFPETATLKYLLFNSVGELINQATKHFIKVGKSILFANLASAKGNDTPSTPPIPTYIVTSLFYFLFLKFQFYSTNTMH